jgi:hypothetical protein
MVAKLPKTISTDQQLNNYIKNHQFSNLNFLGVFARDTKPKKIKKNECFIFNTDNIGQPGTHWVAVCNNILYDSFGKISTFKYPVYSKRSNNNVEQDLIEENCGWRCIAWLSCCDVFGVYATSRVI